MPNSSKKQKNEAAKPNVSPQKAKQKSDCNATPKSVSMARKRKRRKTDMSSDETELESELEECNFDDALALERKLRKIAKNNSLNDEEMKKLLQKFVKNDHVLALVTLKAEDELAREKRESEQPAIIVTENPSVPKLTRAKARELNKTPAITIPALSDTPQPEIATLINEDLQSDEEDEEYTLKEEDFVSDDDHNNTNSDFDSNPCTPQTPLTQTEYEESPVKLTSDGCFKIPLDKQNTTQENLRIATRTRSKLSLQQTTIEDIQSEFVPPDVDLNENPDIDAAANDKDWMEFLTYISNPLNNSLLGDDDDPVNDPEYVAADKEPMDAEELRNVNISKKELTELFAELFEGLVNEGISLESVDLETPEKFLQNHSTMPGTPTGNKLTPTTNMEPCNVSTVNLADVTRQIDFGDTTPCVQQVQQNCVSDATISSTNIAQQNYDFQTDIPITAPVVFANATMDTQNTVIPIASSTDVNNSDITIPAATSAPELIAIPVPGQPNRFNLARVVESNQFMSNDASSILESSDKLQNTGRKRNSSKNHHDIVSRYTLPYDNNFTWRYISIRRHVYTEYMNKFENLRNVKNSSNNALPEEDTQATGFTPYQHDLLQQQLRIHVQMLTQTYIQIYCHPEYWKLAPEIRSLLDDLEERSKTHATFNAWNLKGAIDIVQKWEEDLASDTPENKAFMEFIHKEISFCCHSTRQVPRFPPRIMELILNSNVFMYPNYLPRIPFTPKHGMKYHLFAPSEYLLIALGLDKHLKRIKKMKLKSTASPYVIACKNIAKDTIFGKSTRRIYDQMKKLLKADYYNPVKYYFEHNRAPPVEQHLIPFENNTVLPPIKRFDELPLAWQNYIEEKNKSATAPKQTNAKTVASAPATPPRPSALNYLDIVREAVGENIQLPDSIIEASEPAASATDATNSNPKKRKRSNKRERNLPSSVTINVNYVFGATPNQSDISSLINSTINTQPNLTTISVSPQRALTSSCYQETQSTTTTRATTTTTAALASSNIVAYNYDFSLQQLEPVVAEITEIPSESTPELPVEETDLQIVEQQVTSKSVCRQPLRRKRHHWRHSHNHNKRFGTSRQRHRAALLYRQKNSLKKRLLQLLTSYHQNLQRQELRFKNSPILLRCFKQFKALDLYTSFLDDLKMICRNAAQANTGSVTGASSATVQSTCTTAAKRPRLDEDSGNTTRSSKKINRQEENLRNMLLPDTPEDANRKDAIYAFNFYEKVEEIFKSDNRLEDYEKFNNILKNFDPKCERASDLYTKLEALFMPDYPLLAQVFLTFLLPAEAAEIGKFFEHFMITNSTTFYNKLNIYFSNQPAQMRKILSCLNDLAEETDVTMKKLEERILPLLKGNQFLIDWFMQQFPEARVPERILPPPETVILKEVHGKQGGESMETVRDILESPTSDQQPPCQLRYINGRIFYGSKFTLPAKLSFMASKSAIKDETISSPPKDAANFGCLHGIKEHGEARLAAAAAAVAASTPANAASTQTSNDGTSDDGNDKSEEDEISKALVIDTTSTAGEDDSCSSIEACDDATLRAHALRLNPNYYSNTCFSSITATSTPNIGNAHQAHHLNAKKQSLNFYDDVKLSPRKSITSSPIDALNSGANAAAANIREKRKSPTKKIKSPNSLSNSNKSHQAQQRGQHQPMVVIPRGEHSAGAIAFAHKLKTLVESSDEQIQPPAGTAQMIVSAEAPIVARVKQRPLVDLTTTRSNDDSIQHNLIPKLENSDDLEFLPEHTPPRDDQTDFPRLQLEPDSSTEDSTVVATTKAKQQQPATQNMDSDEDYKVDIVATLTTAAETNVQQTSDANAAATTSNSCDAATVARTSSSAAFTRDEDKILLLEMQAGSRDRDDLIRRISKKLPQRTRAEIIGRHQFLIDFLSRMQGN